MQGTLQGTDTSQGTPQNHFDFLGGEHLLRGSDEDIEFFKNYFPKSTKSLEEKFIVPKWYRRLLTGFTEFSKVEGKEGEVIDKCSYPGLINMGNRSYTILYNPGGVSYKTSFIEMLGDEQYAINISSNVVAKGQDAIMFVLSKLLWEMEMEMLYDCKYSNPPPTDLVVERPAPYEPIVGATYLDTQYTDRVTLLDLGARWDHQRRSWYVPQGLDLSAFERWNPNAERREQRGGRGGRGRRRVIEDYGSEAEEAEEAEGAQGAEEAEEAPTADERGRFEKKMAMTVNSFVDTTAVPLTALFQSRKDSRLYKWQACGSLVTIDIARGDKMLYDHSFWVMLENLLSSRISSDKYTGFEFKFKKHGFHPEAHVPRILLATNGVVELDGNGQQVHNALPKKFLHAESSPIGPDRPLVLFLDSTHKLLDVHLKTHEFLEQMHAELVAANQRESFENNERKEALLMGTSGVPIGQCPAATSMRCVYFSAMETHFLRSNNDVARRFWESVAADVLKPGQMGDPTVGCTPDPLIHSLFRHFTPFAEFAAGRPDQEGEAYDWLRGALGTSEAPFKLTPIDFNNLSAQENKNHFFQPLCEVASTLKVSEAAWRDGPLKGLSDGKAQVICVKKTVNEFCDEIGISFDMARFGTGGKQGLRAFAKVNSRIVADNELCDMQAALTVSYFFFFHFILPQLPKTVDEEFTELAKAEAKKKCMRFRNWQWWAWNPQ